jgi:hypothetical protein
MYLKESDLKPTPNWVGCLVLKDLSGRVGAVVARSQGLAPPQPTTEELLDLNQKFWTWCWYVFGKIERGELWEALDGIHAIRSIVRLRPTRFDEDPLEIVLCQGILRHEPAPGYPLASLEQNPACRTARTFIGYRLQELGACL